MHEGAVKFDRYIRELWCARSVALLTLTALAGCKRAHGEGAGTSAVVTGTDAAVGVEQESEPTAAQGKLASRAMESFVFEGPSRSTKKLGYLRAGAIVDRTGGVAAKTKDCPNGWFPIAPRGFVCVGTEFTHDLQHPIVKASWRRPALDAGLPYGYAVVRNSGAPFYSRLPTKEEAKRFEPDWDYHFRTLVGAETDEAKEGMYPQLSSLPEGPLPIEPAPGVLAPWATDNSDDPLPAFLASGGTVPNLSGLIWSQRTPYDGGTTCDPQVKGCIPLDASRPRKRLGVSFVATYRAGDRRWLMTTDLLLMPADRVRLVRGTSFHGVDLAGSSSAQAEGKPSASAEKADAAKAPRADEKLELPIIFVKKEGAKRYAFDGKRMVASDTLPFRAALGVTAKQRVVASVHYHELNDGSYVAAPDSVRLDPIKKMPKWGKDGERWIEINLAKQTLLALDGERPVYATLVSTGSGGLESATDNPYVTPRGIFRIHTKHAAATMDSNQPEAEFELRDVPYIQYFKDGFALHAAYWHDQFGSPRSHGCINLAPLDAQRLFAFTKPELPVGWHGVMQGLTGTVVWIHA
ncbi:MAG: hypothetical protein NVSMB1_21530 [Polyangiales bacterium]